MTAPHKWAPGLPTKKTRVSLWCGDAAGALLAGTVVDDGPEVCVVHWDHGSVQAHPISQLVPEKGKLK